MSISRQEFKRRERRSLVKSLLSHENVDFIVNFVIGIATKMRLLNEYLKVRSFHFIILCHVQFFERLASNI
jgi:hypothetical protein